MKVLAQNAQMFTWVYHIDRIYLLLIKLNTIVIKKTQIILDVEQ